MRIQPFRLKEDVVAVLGDKTVNLVLDRRAVARADAVNHAGIKRRTIQTGTDDLVCALIGAGHPAGQLAQGGLRAAEEGKKRQRIVRMLLAHDRKIDAARIEPRRGSGFQPPDRQGQFTQTGRQRRRRRLAHASAGRLRQANVNLAVKESPRRQHHGLCHETQPMFSHRPANPPVFDNQIVATLREQREIRLVLKEMADRLPVMRPVGLYARGAHRRTFGGVEDAELDASPVRGNPHRPVQRIDLAHQMPLADPAN